LLELLRFAVGPTGVRDGSLFVHVDSFGPGLCKPVLSQRVSAGGEVSVVVGLFVRPAQPVAHLVAEGLGGAGQAGAVDESCVGGGDASE
jgi:hypothetical protein